MIPGRNIGRLHVLKKVGNFNGEDCFLCRDERGRNIQFVESEIIAQAREGEEAVEELPPEKSKEPSPVGPTLESLMSKPIETLEGQEIVTILMAVHGDNPPDNLSVDELRHRLEEKSVKPESEESEKSPPAGLPEEDERPSEVEEEKKPLPKPKKKTKKKKTKKKKGDK